MNPKGIGLGLHISKKIVHKLGGEIECYSEWKKGCKFTFIIALDEMKESNIMLSRILNKQVYIHQKITLAKLYTLNEEAKNTEIDLMDDIVI